MRCRFVEEAFVEFREAALYYNRQASGLGEAFADEIEKGIGVILEDPAVWRVIEEDVRRYLVRRFPYGIYYPIEEREVVIWAVKHLHRDPDYWQGRRC